MLFPIRTDRQLRHTPFVNVGLVVCNVVVFVLSHQGSGALKDSFTLDPTTPLLVQYISYQFLHANWEHLFFNMIFLYVFGNSVEDRLGKVGYLGFYLAGGVIAGLGHALLENNPVLGASGSVAAVTGAYLALFPLSNVTIFYWFFIMIGTFEVSSIVLILFQVGCDATFQLMGFGGVAYLAHLAGYAYGFGLGMGLLKLRLLPHEPFDLLSLLEQRRRRGQFRTLTRGGYQPWEAQKKGEPPKQAATGEVPGDENELMELRNQLTAALNSHELDRAVDLYAQLLQQQPDQVMSQQHQLDLANHLMATGQYEMAARAYELFLNAYRNYPSREQVELILGLLYIRYLDRTDRGRELLTNAIPRLHDPQQKQIAEEMIKETE